MGEKYYSEALFSELEICLKQVKTELKDAYGYFESKGDYDGSCLTETEYDVLFSLWESVNNINTKLGAERAEVPYTPIYVPLRHYRSLPPEYFEQKEKRISQHIKAIRDQRKSLINSSNTPLIMRFGEFYGYTIYNILYKNYEWIKYALEKYNSDLYGSKEYQAAIERYFNNAFAFYMRFENSKA